MKIPEWNEECSTGIEEIDSQHRHLLSLAERLRQAIERSEKLATMASVLDELDTVTNVIQELVEYASYHFENEERYMQAHAYPEYDQHLKAHIQSAQKIKDCAILWQKRRDRFSIDVAEFLNDFWHTHVLEYDRRLGQFLKEQGLS